MPLIKLIGVVIKSLSKPISVYVKDHLKDSPTFAKHMTFVGRKYQKLTNFMMSTQTSYELDQGRAISLGSEIMVEFLFFVIAGGIIVYDYGVSKKKSAIINSKLMDLTNQTEKLQDDMISMREEMIILNNNNNRLLSKSSGFFYK